MTYALVGLCGVGLGMGLAMIVWALDVEWSRRVQERVRLARVSPEVGSETGLEQED